MKTKRFSTNTPPHFPNPKYFTRDDNPFVPKLSVAPHFSWPPTADTSLTPGAPMNGRHAWFVFICLKRTRIGQALGVTVS